MDRNGSVSVQEFPAHLGTIGLPVLALVFHLYYREEYEFSCEGRGEWRGKPAWLVHFRQRNDQANEMRVYRMSGMSFPFSHFLLFSVQDSQRISEPKESEDQGHRRLATTDRAPRSKPSLLLRRKVQACLSIGKLNRIDKNFKLRGAASARIISLDEA